MRGDELSKRKLRNIILVGFLFATMLRQPRTSFKLLNLKLEKVGAVKGLRSVSRLAFKICEIPVVGFFSSSHFSRSNHSKLDRSHFQSLSMSNSTSDSTLGDCVVCGIRTPTRCSECASNGTKWMYFCSREHQKLVRNCLVSSIYSIVPLK